MHFIINMTHAICKSNDKTEFKDSIHIVKTILLPQLAYTYKHVCYTHSKSLLNEDDTN